MERALADRGRFLVLGALIIVGAAAGSIHFGQRSELETLAMADAAPPKTPPYYPDLLVQMGSLLNYVSYFEGAYSDRPALDTFVADDFVVPAGHVWTIQQIEWCGIPGAGWMGLSHATALICDIFADANGQPAGVPIYDDAVALWSESWSPSDPAVTLADSSYEADFWAVTASPPVLNAGHYWLSCYPMGPVANGYYGMWVTEMPHYDHALVTNPGGGASNPSIPNHWTDFATVFGSAETDIAFRGEGIDTLSSDDDDDDNDDDDGNGNRHNADH